MKNLLKKTQRTLLSLTLSLAATAFLASCEKTSDAVQPTVPAAAVASQDFRGPESIKAINVNEDYYYQTNTFNRISSAGFNTVRIVIRPQDGNTAWTHNNGIYGIKRMLHDAKALGLSVILAYYVRDYMDAYNPNAMYNASQWWLGNLSVLKPEGEYAINILNEPRAAGDAVTWRNQQTNAVQRLRSNGFTGPIVIDAPGYGHETRFLSQEGGNVAPYNTNVIFSLHVYPDSFYNGGLPGTTNPGSGGGDVTFMNNLRAAAQRPIIIGEFGDTGGQFTNFRGRVQEFVNNAQQSNANCGATGWAWNGDGLGMNAADDASYLSWIQSVAVN